MNKIIVGFGHKAQIGKDYAANHLKQHFDVERIAFADGLKEDLAPLFLARDVPYWDIANDVKRKNVLRPLWVEYGLAMRHFHPDAWVDRALLGHDLTHEFTIITDVRFPNEVKRLRELGGVYVDILADVPCANATEESVDLEMTCMADYKVHNNFDETFLKDMVQLFTKLKHHYNGPHTKN